jgi:hemolysin activation/secretion protein
LLAFYDMGDVADLHQQYGGPQHVFLQSVGFGIRYDIGRYLDVRLDDGWQLSKAPGEARTRNLANISATFSY